MFGKPEWFVPKKFGWGLTPVTWQGWVYTILVAVLIAAPFNILLIFVGWPEAIIWMGVSIAALCADVYLILKAIKASEKSEDNGLNYPGGESARNESLRTNHLDLRVANKK